MNKCIPYKYTFLVLFILIGYVYCADQPNDQSKDVKGIGSVDCDSDQEEDNFQVTELTEISKDDQRQDDILQNSNEIIIGEEEIPVPLEQLNQEAQEAIVPLEQKTEHKEYIELETVPLEQEQNQEAQEETVELEQEQVPMIYYGPQYQTQPIPMSQHTPPNYYVTGFDHNYPRYGPQPMPPLQQYPLPTQPQPQPPYQPQPQQPYPPVYYQPQPVYQQAYQYSGYQQQPTPQYYTGYGPYQTQPPQGTGYYGPQYQPVQHPQPSQQYYQHQHQPYQGYQPQQPYYGPMLQPPPVTRYPLPPPQPAPQQPQYGPIPHPIPQYGPPQHVQGYITYPFIQQERILTNPSIISYPHVQFRLSGPKPQPKLPFPEPRGYFRPDNPIFARHNTKFYSQNKYLSQSSSDQSDEQQTKAPTQTESSSHQPTKESSTEAHTQTTTQEPTQKPTQHIQLTTEPSIEELEPETIPVEIGSDEDEEPPEPPQGPGDGDQPEEGEGDEDEEEYEEGKKPSKVVKKCNKISLLKKNEEGELIEMIEGEDYKVIWKNSNKSKYEFLGNLEEILCDGEVVYTNRPENGYPSLLTYNITLSVFVLRRQGGHVVVKCVDGKWIPEGRKIPGFMKMFIKDYFGNEIELVEGDYFLDLTACKSYKYTFAVGIACTRIEVRGETVWEKTDDDPFPISCCITFKMNLIVNFGQYKKIFAKRRGVFKLLIIKNK